VVPQAIAANDLLLPPGVECDDCNNYLAQLDEMLAQWPLSPSQSRSVGFAEGAARPDDASEG
jgi:hypothetical protein